MRQTFELTVTEPQTAADALAEHTGLSKGRIKDAMTKGACWWTYKGKQLRLRRATKAMQPGIRMTLYYDDKVLALKPSPAECLLDNKRYSVWYKPHGMLAQGSQWGDHCSLLRWAEQKTGRDCFLVHRLDADAAGLMVIAHDPKAAGELSKLFQGRTIRKVYQAWVCGQLAADDRLIEAPVEGKAAVSRVSTLSQADNQTLVSVTIETGRKHQIRRHLAGIGHPIVSDRLYGQGTPQPLQLVAVELEFQCPLRHRPVRITLPEQLQLAPQAET
ncbi:RluA family pseudouridine synthase [Marinobacter zhejiangensis]|uniref:tRNA pseudouridine32 synthase / 23S rRNA pseudouridine746 synthase n=1 Tax=Marinobacter zhejiangensis TaxID=488535 RepID=A0A1I4LWM7_9GAMM|nr:RNA pseudouridine synthase [Marinobacter zhejiangensis]SFL95352.1 tRNA pseudouridine32 synthase / 23S rRNA pseudouridine746 synthase [Marinobacter zhejiangensis]